MASYLTACLMVLSALAYASSSIAADTETRKRKVEAAILLVDHPDPIIGQALGDAATSCEVISHIDLGLTVTIIPPRQKENQGTEVKIQCPQPCSFRSGKSKTRIGKDRVFDILNGGDDAIGMKLIYRPRAKIGELALIIDDDELLATKAATSPTTDN